MTGIYMKGVISMNPLEQIEQRFGFKYPELYKRLYNDGMLDWGKYSSKWHATYWEDFKSNPPLLLFGDDIELFTLDRIIEHAETLIDPKHPMYANPEFKFIPFAMTGRGDLYVFQLDKQCDEDIPIVLLPRDCNEAMLLAKNLQDFIFRMLIECVVNIDGECSRVADGDLKANLFNMLRTHRAYISQSQSAQIEEIYHRQLFEHILKYPNGREENLIGLISMEELKNTLQTEIEFDGLNEEYMCRDD